MSESRSSIPFCHCTIFMSMSAPRLERLEKKSSSKLLSFSLTLSYAAPFSAVTSPSISSITFLKAAADMSNFSASVLRASAASSTKCAKSSRTPLTVFFMLKRSSSSSLRTSSASACSRLNSSSCARRYSSSFAPIISSAFCFISSDVLTSKFSCVITRSFVRFANSSI